MAKASYFLANVISTNGEKKLDFFAAAAMQAWTKFSLPFRLNRIKHSTIDSVLPLHKVASGSILSIPKIFSLDDAEIYWQHCLERWTEAW